MPNLPLAVQLYTLRDLVAANLPATLQQVAALGYTGVELAGYGSLKNPADIRKALDDNHLKMAGSHIGLEAMETDLNRVMDENDILGNKNLVIPGLAKERRADAAGWKRIAQTLNELGQKVQSRGFKLAYHNHSFEFEQFDGQTGMDILYANAQPQNLKAELDVYWIRHGGQDPVAYINRHAGRILLIHLKDMAAGPEQRFAPVGTGTLDIRGITAAAQTAGAQWLIVEQDNTYDTPPLDALRTSMENLKKMALA